MSDIGSTELLCLVLSYSTLAAMKSLCAVNGYMQKKRFADVIREVIRKELVTVGCCAGAVTIARNVCTCDPFLKCSIVAEEQLASCLYHRDISETVGNS